MSLNLSTVDALLPEGMNDVVTPYPATPFQSLFFYCDHSVFISRTGTDDFNLQPNIVLTGPQFQG
jgi:hypothetical protein